MELDTRSTDAKPRAVKESIGSYCIWTKTGRKPFYYHPTLEAAEAEAERLAAKHPGKKFLVMKMESKFGVPRPETADQPGVLADA